MCDFQPASNGILNFPNRDLSSLSKDIKASLAYLDHNNILNNNFIEHHRRDIKVFLTNKIRFGSKNNNELGDCSLKKHKHLI